MLDDKYPAQGKFKARQLIYAITKTMFTKKDNTCPMGAFNAEEWGILIKSLQDTCSLLLRIDDITTVGLKLKNYAFISEDHELKRKYEIGESLASSDLFTVLFEDVISLCNFHRALKYITPTSEPPVCQNDLTTFQ